MRFLCTVKYRKIIKVDCIDVSKYALAKWRYELTPTIDKGFIENADINIEVEVNLQNAGETT